MTEAGGHHGHALQVSVVTLQVARLKHARTTSRFHSWLSVRCDVSRSDLTELTPQTFVLYSESSYFPVMTTKMFYDLVLSNCPVDEVQIWWQLYHICSPSVSFYNYFKWLFQTTMGDFWWGFGNWYLRGFCVSTHSRHAYQMSFWFVKLAFDDWNFFFWMTKISDFMWLFMLFFLTCTFLRI